MILIKLVLFVVWMNFLPFLAHLIFGDRGGRAVDGGLHWFDGRRVLGDHKTWRGIAVSLVGAALAAPLLDLEWQIGGLTAGLAMAGDLMTSFIKRRLGYAEGKAVFGLDQALEGLLPLAVLAPTLDLPAWKPVLAWAAFVPIAHAGACYWHYVLAHPPMDGYPRLIRSTTRLREWRACHTPLAHWQTWLNFESYVYYRVIMAQFFRATGWYQHGIRNALAPQVSRHELWFEDLPASFDGYRILLLTDLHLDGLQSLPDILIERIAPLDEVDLCLIGGDVRMEMYGPMAPSIRQLKRLLKQVRSVDGIYGVLGNHDCIEMLPELEQAGVDMLVNDAELLQRGHDTLCLAGVDDPHYYRCHDVELALRKCPVGTFTILLAHSPEIFREAAIAGIRLYLCGHTHGGQICAPRLGPVFTHSRAPRRTAAGPWSEGNMLGFTSRGAGASGLPLRFNCPGEIALLTLRRSG